MSETESDFGMRRPHEMRERRRAYPLKRVENQAYCVMQWLSGVSQHDIGAQFGYYGAPSVCLAIWQFIRRMDEDYMALDRKPVAHRALMKFIAERNAS